MQLGSENTTIVIINMAKLLGFHKEGNALNISGTLILIYVDLITGAKLPTRERNARSRDGWNVSRIAASILALIWNLVLVPLQHIVSSRTEVQEGLLDHPHHEPEAKVLFP